MGKLEEDVKEFLGDVEGLFSAIVGDPKKYLRPEFANDPELVKTLQGAFKEIQGNFPVAKKAIDDLQVPLETLDPILPLKMAIYKKVTGKEE
jgi:hypothetical protein